MLFSYYILGAVALVSVLIAPTFVLVKFGTIIQILEEDFPEEWEKLGRPSRWGGSKPNSSQLRMIVVMTTFILTTPDWISKSPDARKTLRHLRLIHIAVICIIVIFIIWGQVLRSNLIL